MKKNKLISTLVFSILLSSAVLAHAINITVPSAPGTGYYLQSTSSGAYTPRIGTSSIPVFGSDGNITLYLGSTKACSGSDQVTSITVSPTGTISTACSAQGAGGGGADGVGITTSSQGQYTRNNIPIMYDSSTIIAFDNLNYASNTNRLTVGNIYAGGANFGNTTFWGSQVQFGSDTTNTVLFGGTPGLGGHLIFRTADDIVDFVDDGGGNSFSIQNVSGLGGATILDITGGIVGLSGTVNLIYAEGTQILTGLKTFGNIAWTNATGTELTITNGRFLTSLTAATTTVSTTLRVGDGIEGSPSLAFISEPSLGFHRQAAGVIDANVLTQFRIDINTSSQIYDFAGTSFLPSPDATNNLGGASNRWNAGWINGLFNINATTSGNLNVATLNGAAFSPCGSTSTLASVYNSSTKTFDCVSLSTSTPSSLAGRSLTANGAAIDADAELYTGGGSISISNPSSTTDGAVYQILVPGNATLVNFTVI